MIRRWSKKTKQMIAAIGVTFIICSLATLIGLAAMQRQWTHERAQYEREMEKLNVVSAPADHQPVTSQVWQFTRQLHAGEVITTKDIELIRLDSSAVPDGRVKEKDNIIGQLVKIDVSPRMMIVPSMLAAPDTLEHDIRWVETAVIQLPLQLKKEDVLDIRIRFPNGLDYVLISHKRVLDLQKPTIWFHLTEQELLMLSSAYVDAFINGGQLYAVRYVDHMVQNKAVVNYPVREDVLQLIKKDPNIVQKAQAALSEQSRKVLEQQLEEYKQIDVSNGSFTTSHGPQTSQGSSSVDPLHYSPFTGMAPETQAQSPFVGEASTNTNAGQTGKNHTQDSKDTTSRNSNTTPNTEIPQQQTEPFTDPDQAANTSTSSVEMKSSQSQDAVNGQP